MNRTTILITLLIIGISVQALAEDNFNFFFKNKDDYKDVIIEEVRSADRFVIYNSENKKEIIKLIGLKAPKAPRIKKVKPEWDQYGFPVKQISNPVTTIEEQAFEFSRELLENKRVRLEFDSSKKDDANNTLAYVFLLENDTFVNQEILRQGFANLQIRPPNTKYKKELRQAYQEARREKRGLQGQ